MPDFLQDLYERSVVDLPLEQRMLVCIYNLLGRMSALPIIVKQNSPRIGLFTR